MTDKYEEFKEWWSRKGFTTNPFIEFEEEQAEKEKENEIKDTIKQALEENHCCSNGTTLYTNAIYKKLEEKELSRKWSN